MILPLTNNTMNLCPCGSNSVYTECCQPTHQSSKANTPEQLMRARYCAHCLKLTDFIINTYHSSCQADSFREEIEASTNSNWLNLQILNAPIADENEGFVEFKATFVEHGQQSVLHEKSRFVIENNSWRYIDGTYPEQDRSIHKIGRNDPCPCGSGRKFKKCCDA